MTKYPDGAVLLTGDEVKGLLEYLIYVETLMEASVRIADLVDYADSPALEARVGPFINGAKVFEMSDERVTTNDNA